MPVGEVIQVHSSNTFRTTMGFIKLEGVLSIYPNTSKSGMAKDKLERLILHKRINYKIKYRDENGRAVAQVWMNLTNINMIMKEYIRSLSKFTFSIPITQS
jgi:hypothetical protein